jgi:hypothetical protein
MKKEELIRIFKEWKRRDEEQLNQADTLENIEIYDSAIKALEQEPKIEWIPLGEYEELESK